VPESEEETMAEDGVSGSPIQRVVGSGWTWIAVYILAFALMFALYGLAPKDTAKAKLTAAQIELDDTARALALYGKENGGFPAPDDLIPSLRGNQTDASKGPYLRTPLDGIDIWNNRLVYEVTGDGASYTLLSAGPDGQAGTADDLRPASGR
jgi:general secretion pathway protein G